jgi:cystathionine beta-lyase
MHWHSQLVDPETLAPGGFRSLATPVYRGSTVLFDNAAQVVDDWRHAQHGYTYGLYGTPTAIELGARIAQLERARHSFIVPGGQAAIALVYLACCGAGSHALVPFNAYGPNRAMADGLLKRMGIEVQTYDPLIGAGIAALIRPNTTLVWTESPGSVTMEVQDVPAIVAAARTRGVPVALDNTYAAGVYFDAFAHGVDISMQALCGWSACRPPRLRWRAGCICRTASPPCCIRRCRHARVTNSGSATLPARPACSRWCFWRACPPHRSTRLSMRYVCSGLA